MESFSQETCSYFAKAGTLGLLSGNRESILIKANVKLRTIFLPVLTTSIFSGQQNKNISGLLIDFVTVDNYHSTLEIDISNV